ncbi:hypothetical protein B4U80_11850, partial [Leptotrombidium deliense]
ENKLLQILIAVRNDFVEFFALPIKIRNDVDHFVAYIQLDKHGRRYTWIPFREKKTGKPFLAQVWVLQSVKFASFAAPEQLIAQHGYYSTSENIPFLHTEKKALTQQSDLNELNTLGLKSTYYILTVIYPPSLCSSHVYNRHWVNRHSCDIAQWIIHGLWSQKDQLQELRRYYCKTFDWRPEADKVQSLDDVPQRLQTLNFHVSAKFKNDIEYWDYEWCSHGYFMRTKRNERRFRNAMEYFNFILNRFDDLKIMSKMRGLVPTNNKFFPESKWYKFVSKFSHEPVAHKLIIFQTQEETIFVEPYQMEFCFNLQNKSINCAEAGMSIAESTKTPFRQFHLSSSYSLYDYVVLRLLVTCDVSLKLRIDELAPSTTYLYTIIHYVNDRKHHAKAFKEQVLTDNRHEEIFASFERAWFKDPLVNVSDAMKTNFENSAILFYNIREIFNKPLDYFATTTELYDKLRAHEWLDNDLGEEITADTFERQLKETYFSQIDPNVVPFVFLCIMNENKEVILHEIVVCYTTDFNPIECSRNVEHLRRGKGKRNGKGKHFKCPSTFRMPYA